jgi:exopolysaccharide biosynthesis protein
VNPNVSPRRFVARPRFGSLYISLAAAFGFALGPAAARGATLPAALAPPAPFPLVTAASVEREPVAPGVSRATYRLLTSAGPLVVSVVLADPAHGQVRLGTVLARDRIVSDDETVSSMARRTGAVAGINGDYFDIDASGAPVGVLVRDGALARSPSARAALTVTRGRAVRFETYRFAGTAASGVVSVPISGLNVWPPEGGATLLTPAYGGTPPPTPGVVVERLEPLTAGSGAGLAPAPGPGATRYRVSTVTSGPPFAAENALRIAYGPAAQGFGPLPDVGDVVTVTADTDPSLSDVAAALGGGPLLLQNGAPVDDPASPNYADRERRIPAAAAARFPDGSLALVVVDGRHPATSVGVSRAELIALLRGLGASDALLFDSGGSATLVARKLGDAEASVVNDPSDGVERRVADGLFVYSDAPLGPPDRLVLRPGRLAALAGARVPLRARIVDAADHGLGDARGPWRLSAPPDVVTIDADDVLHVGVRTGSYAVRVARGGVAAELPLAVLDRVARLTIGPPRANPDPHAAVSLTVEAFDAHDRPVAVDGVVRWRAANGAAIDPRGRLVAGERDALVTANAGGISASLTVPVGRHPVPLGWFGDRQRPAWKLVTAPANGPGAVDLDAGALRLGYDFGAGERAAYASAGPALPLGDALALSCAVGGDGNGAALRAGLADRYGDRATITFARALDFSGTRRLSAKIPPSLAPPLTLRSFYVVGTLASPPVSAAGTVTVADCVATVPGSTEPATTPKPPAR